MTYYIVGYKLETKKGAVVKLCGNHISALFWRWYYRVFKGTSLFIVEWFTHGDDLP